jgi:hypothetical protein
MNYVNCIPVGARSLTSKWIDNKLESFGFVNCTPLGARSLTLENWCMVSRKKYFDCVFADHQVEEFNTYHNIWTSMCVLGEKAVDLPKYLLLTNWVLIIILPLCTRYLTWSCSFKECITLCISFSSMWTLDKIPYAEVHANNLAPHKTFSWCSVSLGTHIMVYQWNRGTQHSHIVLISYQHKLYLMELKHCFVLHTWLC